MRVYIFKTNKKPLALLGVAMLIGTLSFAQSLAPQAVNTAGVKFTQANGSLNFTVGELVVKNQTDANGNTLGSGFTNAATGSTTVLSVNTPDKDVLNVSVYPNPTTDLLTVDVAATTLSQLVVEITDLQGKTLSSSQYAGISNKIGINTAAYAVGTYLLLLKNESGKLLGNYKIIKQ
jgi:hypothetical protein